MATKSILKNIVIRDKASATKFINALEYAHQKKGKKVTIRKTVNYVKANQIDKLFSSNK